MKWPGWTDENNENGLAHVVRQTALSTQDDVLTACRAVAQIMGSRHQVFLVACQACRRSIGDRDVDDGRWRVWIGETTETHHATLAVRVSGHEMTRAVVPACEAPDRYLPEFAGWLRHVPRDRATRDDLVNCLACLACGMSP